MTTAKILNDCMTRGIRLSVADDRQNLVVDAPRNAITADLLKILKYNKAELLRAIEQFEERAAIMEFDGNFTRDDAERVAWKYTITQLLAVRGIGPP